MQYSLFLLRGRAPPAAFGAAKALAPQSQLACWREKRKGNTMTQPKAFLYARQSVQEGLHPYSIEAQLHDMHVEATRRGFQVVAEYTENISGQSLNRPRLQALLEATKTEDVQYVLVDRLDRLTRGGMQDLEAVLDVLRKNEVSLISVKQDLDTSSASGAFQLRFFAVLANFQLQVLKENQRNAREDMVRHGLLISTSVPFGYRYNSATKKPEINEFEAGVVRDIFNMHVNEGLGAMRIATAINEDYGLELKTFNVNSVLQRSCTYAGYYVSDKYGERSNTYPAIITEKLAKESDDIRNQYTAQRTNEFRMLRKKISCGVCGRWLTPASQSGGYARHYQCSANHAHKQDGKPTVLVPMLETEEAVQTAVKSFLQNTKFSQALDNLVEKSKSDQQQEARRINAQVEQQQVVLVKQFESGDLDEQQFTDALHELLAQAKADKNAAQTQESPTLAFSLERFWSDEAYQQRVVAKLLDHVTVDDQKRQGKFLTGVYLKGAPDDNILTRTIKIK